MEILPILKTNDIVGDIKLKEEEFDRIAEAVDFLSKLPTDLTIISNQKDLTNDEISVNKSLLNLVNPSLYHHTIDSSTMFVPDCSIHFIKHFLKNFRGEVEDTNLSEKLSSSFVNQVTAEVLSVILVQFLANKNHNISDCLPEKGENEVQVKLEEITNIDKEIYSMIGEQNEVEDHINTDSCLLYTSPSPRD